LPKTIIANNRIRAKEVRIIDKEGKQLGVFTLKQALEKAQAVGLDLIQVTEKVNPPICKIIDFGKYSYRQNKKEKQQKHQHTGELKNIRLTLGISEHDIEVRKKAAEKFIKQGYKIRIEMRLRGREKAMMEFAKEKMKKLFTKLNEVVPMKIEKELQREPRGMTMIISKDEQKNIDLQKKDENEKSTNKKIQSN